jgi:hypothetical protein
MNRDELSKYLEIHQNSLTEKEFFDLLLVLLENNPSDEERYLLRSKLIANFYLDKDRVVHYLETMLHDPRPVEREFAALNLFFLSDGPNSQAYKILSKYLGEEIKEGEEIDQILKRYHELLSSHDEGDG